jgi:mannose-1-phosphate guanylyltransferase
VILAGGVGSRFWPVSTPERPKQLLPLAGEQSLLHDTLRRLQPLVPGERTLVLTNEALVPAIASAVAPFGVPSTNLLAEPVPAGTAAALAWAAIEIERRAGGSAVMLCVHADWAVAQEDKFRAALAHAADVAREHRSLVTIGIVPTRPDPGYGYIHRGRPVAPDVFAADRFVEKPNRVRAAEMVSEGCLWNSGIFVWQAGDFLDELRRHTPEVAAAVQAARAHKTDARAFFASVRPVSIDVGLLERSARVLVIPGDFGWDDVGTWAALSRTRALDAAGNAVYGPVYAKDANGNVVHAEGGAVVLYGVSDLVVVTRDGLTVVTTIERSADLKNLVESLPDWLASRPA